MKIEQRKYILNRSLPRKSELKDKKIFVMSTVNHNSTFLTSLYVLKGRLLRHHLELCRSQRNLFSGSSIEASRRLFQKEYYIAHRLFRVALILLSIFPEFSTCHQYLYPIFLTQPSLMCPVKL